MRLLIISSSKRQKKDKSPLPALERYDGFMFRILKKLKRENKLPADLDIIIISSKFGLLKPEDKVPYVNHMMTFLQAREVKNKFLNEFKKLFDKKNYSEIFVNLGASYLESIKGIEKLTNAKIIYAKGKMGQKANHMKRWILSI